MAVRRKHDLALIILLIIGCVGYASLHSELRLRRDMPPQFFDPSKAVTEKRSSEEKLAKAYWTCAVNEIQWKYGYGRRLPEEPPLEFSVSVAEIGPAARDEAMRRVQWQKLREVWNISDVWSIRYEFSWVTMQTPLRSAANWWSDTFRSLGGR